MWLQYLTWSIGGGPLQASHQGLYPTEMDKKREVYKRKMYQLLVKFLWEFVKDLTRFQNFGNTSL